MVIKRIALIFLCLAGVVFAFHQSLIQWSLELYITHAASKAGFELSYDHVQAKPNQLILNSPILALRDGKGKISAQSVNIGYSFHPLEQAVDLDVDIDSAQIDLRPCQQTIKDILNQISPSQPWFKVHLNIKCKEGRLVVKEHENEHMFIFQVDHCTKENKPCSYSLSSLDENGIEGSLDFTLNDEGGKFFAKDFHLRKLNSLLEALYFLNDWELSSGIINGSFTFDAKKDFLKRMQGELVASGVLFQHKKNKVKAKLQEIKFSQEKGDSNLPVTSFEFSNGSLAFIDTDLYGIMRGLKGKITLDNDGKVEILSNGLWSAGGEDSHAVLESSFNLKTLEKADVELKLHPLNPDSKHSSIQLTAFNLSSKESSLKGNFINVGSREFAFIQRVLDNVQPNFSPIRYVSGTLNAAFSLNFVDKKLASVNVRKLDAYKCFLFIKPLEAALGSDHIHGELAFEVTGEQIQNSLDASLQIENGEVILTGINPELWKFTHIQSRLEINKGIVQPSSASVQLAGLKGKAEILNGNGHDLIKLSFSGKGADLKPFMTTRIQNGIDLSLSEDEIFLTATLKKKGSAVLVEGILETKSAKSSDSPRIPFGFTIERKKAADPSFANLNFEILESIAPLELKPLLYQEISQINQSILYAGLKIRKGWFDAKGLDLKKFADPFLFPDRELELSGVADVSGSFDGSGITIRYGVEKLQLKNENLILEIPIIEKGTAYHSLEFLTMHHYGYIPIANGTYFDRSTGLLFSDIQSAAVLEGKKIHFDDLEAFSNNLYFLGHADIDYSSDEKGAYLVNLHADTVEGSYSSTQQFFEHFDKPFFFTKVPLEGIVGSGPNGVDIVFDIHENDYKLTTKIDGSFSEGKIYCPNADLSLHELSWNFIFDQSLNRLEITDIQGMLLLGNTENIDEYSIHAENILFTDFMSNKGIFDICIKDATDRFIRVKGKTNPSPEDQEAIVFDFDLKNTHFGSLVPEKFELVLRDWNRIDHLLITSKFDINLLLNELERFGSSEILGFSKKNILDLKNKESKGEFLLNLEFEGAKGIFEFNFLGKDVALLDHHFQEVNFNGYNRDERWIIEQLQLDELSISAELFKREDNIKVNFLGLRFGEALLVGLEGNYRLGDPTFEAKVNLFEFNLNKFKDGGKIPMSIVDFPLNGKLKGHGDIRIFHYGQGKLGLETLLETTLNGVKLHNTSINEGAHFKAHFISGEGLFLKDFDGNFTVDGNEGKIGINFKELGYELANEAIKLEGLSFCIDQSMLPWTSKILNRYLPKVFNKQLANQFAGLKKQGVLKGDLSLQSSLLEKSFHLSFENGEFFLFGENRKLDHLTFDSQQDELKISALYTINQHPLWVSARLNPHSLNDGSVLLADAVSDEIEKPALVIDWRTDTKAGVVIQRAQGYLAGLHINLKENISHATDDFAFRLSGEIEVNGHAVRPLLSSALQEAFTALDLGKGYKLQGEFELGKSNEPDLRFFGMLIGKGVELKGYKFDQLSSQVIFEPASCQFLNCTLSDLAGTLHIANLRIDKHSDSSWNLHIPMMSIHELRPSILQTVGEPRPLRKPLVVRQLTMQNIQGTLGRKESFRAEGQLNFINPQKKHTQNVLFAIPSQILTQIGLNLSVLTPISGTIYFDLKNGKFVLKKFKDVYSEGKVSKFYLPHLGVPSTIDLDGNINVQARFKTSLLLKLFEMFTITVKGNIKEPKYSLQRQKYLKKEEVFSSDLTGAYDNETAL